MTQRTPVPTRSSPDTRSISAWSMTAMSSGFRRLVRRLVRLPSRTGPVKLGSAPVPFRAGARGADLRALRLVVLGTAIGRKSATGVYGQAMRARKGGLLRGRQEFLSVLSSAIVAVLRAEHPHELGDEVVAGQCLDRGARDLSACRLRNPEVAARERCDLRQVGDADDLAALSQRAQALADRSGGRAADAGVDLVEHERRTTGRARRREQGE